MRTFATRRQEWLREAHAKAQSGVLLATARRPELRPEGWTIAEVPGAGLPWRVFDPRGAFWGAYATKETAEARAALWAKGARR